MRILQNTFHPSVKSLNYFELGHPTKGFLFKLEGDFTGFSPNTSLSLKATRPTGEVSYTQPKLEVCILADLTTTLVQLLTIVHPDEEPILRDPCLLGKLTQEDITLHVLPNTGWIFAGNTTNPNYRYS
jgi:hypothetical protein